MRERNATRNLNGIYCDHLLVRREPNLRLSIAISMSALLLTAMMHLTALRWCSDGMARIPMRPSSRVLAVLILLFTVHMFEYTKCLIPQRRFLRRSRAC